MSTSAAEPFDSALLERWLDSRVDGYMQDLSDLVRIETVAPAEWRATGWLDTYFGSRGKVRHEPAHPDLARHPAANLNEHVGRADRGTLTIGLGGSPGWPRLLFSAHVDVVPAGPRFPDAYEPRLKDGRLYGRGTADTKGNIVMVAAALDFLREQGLEHAAVTLDLVVEEEIGGNGALSSLLNGRAVDAVVVLEPTDLEVFHGHRGCLEFTATITGRAGHMGGDGISAIFGAVDLIGLLRDLERGLVEEARSDPAFHSYSRPVQVNVGRIQGGEWHGSLAERCEIGGSIGFRPGTDVEEARRLVEALPAALSDPWLRDHVDFRYEGIHNGAYLGDPDSWLARGLRWAAQAAGATPLERRAWCVSCDARLYHDLLGVPVVVFGVGGLDAAHSSLEYLEIASWRLGVHTLARLLAMADDGAS